MNRMIMDCLKVYLNGERNGKEKEYYYYKNRLEFEGEYLNGERN